MSTRTDRRHLRAAARGPVPWTPFRFERTVRSAGHYVPSEGPERMYSNSRYVVIVTLYDEPGFPGGRAVHLSIRRRDRGTDLPWRDLQRLKAELVGSESDAVQMYPAASRTFDGANQYHLLCTPPGVRLPFGLGDGRSVMTPEQTGALAISRGVQAEFEDGPDYDLGHPGLIWSTP